MPASKRQIDSNRKNAKHSTGPKTDLGKQKVSRNAVKHGAYAHDLIIRSQYLKEDPKEFEKLLASITDELKPETLLQESLVRKIANCIWRGRRIVAAETAHIMYDHRTIDGTVNSLFGIHPALAELHDLDIPDIDTEEKQELANLLASLRSVPNHETARHLLYYEMRMDRQLTRAYKLLKELKRDSRLSQTQPTADSIPTLSAPTAPESDSHSSLATITPESTESEREPSIELPETNPNISCPPKT